MNLIVTRFATLLFRCRVFSSLLLRGMSLSPLLSDRRGGSFDFFFNGLLFALLNDFSLELVFLLSAHNLPSRSSWCRCLGSDWFDPFGHLLSIAGTRARLTGRRLVYLDKLGKGRGERPSTILNSKLYGYSTLDWYLIEIAGAGVIGIHLAVTLTRIALLHGVLLSLVCLLKNSDFFFNIFL